MVSNCVLNHISFDILKPELEILKKILKPNGYMHFLIGHDDHWTFHDLKMNFVKKNFCKRLSPKFLSIRTLHDGQPSTKCHRRFMIVFSSIS